MEICTEDLRIIYHIIDSVSADLGIKDGRYELVKHEYVDQISISDNEYQALKNLKFDMGKQFLDDSFGHRYKKNE